LVSFKDHRNIPLSWLKPQVKKCNFRGTLGAMWRGFFPSKTDNLELQFSGSLANREKYKCCLFVAAG